MLINCADTEQGIFKEILAGHIDFTCDPWPTISPGAKDLIKNMLRQDPKKRMLALDVLSKRYVLDVFYLWPFC